MEAMVLVLNPRDNVAVVLKDITTGQVIVLPDGREISAMTDIPYSHKVTISDLAEGSAIYKYGEVIGKTSVDVSCGCWIHTHNMRG